MTEKDFIVNVGPHGTFKRSGKYHTLPSDIDAIFEKMELENTKKITLYFHGGLVNEKIGLDTAIKMEKHFSSINQRTICIVWETGLMETLYTNILKISESKLFEKLVKILTKTLASKLNFDNEDGRGGGGPLTNAQVEEELNKEFPFEYYTQNNFDAKARGAGNIIDSSPILQELEVEYKYVIAADFELVSILEELTITTPNQTEGHTRGFFSTALLVKSVSKIAYRVIMRFINKRDHDFYPTIIEELLRELYIAELGAWVWNSMKIKSRDMWKDNAGVTDLNQYAGRYLFDKLTAYHKAHPDIQINLVGHSAGSIAVCNLLKMSATAYPELVFDNIIFMAPACRVDLFKDEIVSHQNRFKNFRIFTMTDANEKRDILVNFIYPRSLLYLISGVLENEGKDFDAHILGLQRHINNAPPYADVDELKIVHNFLFENEKNRIIFSQTDDTSLDGMRTSSLTHGGFDDDEKTISSIKFMLR